MTRLMIAVLWGAVAFGQTAADPASDVARAIRAHQYDQAVKAARAALAGSPADFRVLTMEAIALSAQGHSADALEAYHQALRLAPDYVAALEGAAQIEYESGGKDAITLLDRLLKLRPDDSTAHAMRAVMAWNQHDCAAAAQHFGLAGSVISAQPSALREYAECLARLHRPADAIPVLRRLAALDPNDRQVRLRLAEAQLMGGGYADAVETLAPLVDGKDADPDALDLTSAAAEGLGDTPRAVAALRQAIVLAPENPRFYVDFASLCLTHKSFETGIAMIDAGLRRMPNTAELFVARGVLNVQLAKYDDADADFATAERLDPRQAYGSFARSLSDIQQNDFGKALATVREQLKTRPDDEFLYYLLAEILTSQGAVEGSPEFEEAIQAALHAIRLKPDFSMARDLLSRLYLESGQTAQAIEQCRLALRDDASDATALYRLIRALQKSGKASDAAEIPALLSRFNDLRRKLSNQEDDEARYKLLVDGAPPATR
jgi:tetratricopeptide (TPR) repeat protein